MVVCEFLLFCLWILAVVILLSDFLVALLLLVQISPHVYQSVSFASIVICCVFCFFIEVLSIFFSVCVLKVPQTAFALCFCSGNSEQEKGGRE